MLLRRPSLRVIVPPGRASLPGWLARRLAGCAPLLAMLMGSAAAASLPPPPPIAPLQPIPPLPGALPDRIYVLPDPLRFQSGSPVRTPEQWFARRRPELLGLMQAAMYGRAPGRPADLTFESVEPPTPALAGLALREQVRITFTGSNAQRVVLNVLVYRPREATGPVPAIVALNFWGNHAIQPDPGIRLAETWIEASTNRTFADLRGVVDHRATDAARGGNAGQWPVETILRRGYALVTLYRQDVVNDGPPGAAPSPVPDAFPDYAAGEDNFSAMAAWAWALQRLQDYVETNPALDARRVALLGWSRLGKAALWAAANDPRFALVLSHQSGAGGAALFRLRGGEDIARLNRNFPHWYARAFRRYNHAEDFLPFDQHEVLALIAPRPLLVTSATQDTAASIVRQVAAVDAARPVYAFLGVPDRLEHWSREGDHDVTAEDWAAFLDFADRHLAKNRVSGP